eukprot:TRINITY_DN606_c1_g1_i3.p1 TRINITY_DN606_c1_g1~~TRINITY_DN606_c1_g1_i3.p1  ORF type:complete len:428 (+),score=53.74 TRINITY_DN606_c1_g1_i3:59-1342(+)
MESVAPLLIIPGYYTSNELSACTKENVVACDVRFLVNLNFPRCSCHFDEEPNFEYYNFDYSVNELDVVEYVKNFYSVVEKSLSEGNNLLAYSNISSRNGFFALSFLLFHYRCSIREAFQYILSISSRLEPEIDLLIQLKDIEIKLTGQSSLLPSCKTHRILPLFTDRVIHKGSVPRLTDLIIHKNASIIEKKLIESINQDKWDCWFHRSSSTESVEVSTTGSNSPLLPHIWSEYWFELVRRTVYRHVVERTSNFVKQQHLLVVHSSSTSQVNQRTVDKYIEKGKKILGYVQKTRKKMIDIFGPGISFSVTSALSFLWISHERDTGLALSNFTSNFIKISKDMPVNQTNSVLGDIAEVLSYASLPKRLEFFKRSFLLDYSERVFEGLESDMILISKFENKVLLKDLCERMVEMRTHYLSYEPFGIEAW